MYELIKLKSDSLQLSGEEDSRRRVFIVVIIVGNRRDLILLQLTMRHTETRESIWTKDMFKIYIYIIRYDVIKECHYAHWTLKRDAIIIILIFEINYTVEVLTIILY